MKLLLLNLYPPETMAKYLFSSYLLKAYLLKYFPTEKNFYVDVMDFNSQKPIIEICDAIAKTRPDAIGYSCYIWNIEKIIRIIGKIKNRIKSVHILGGPEISISRASYLSGKGAGDYFVFGEGEEKIIKLMEYITKRKNCFSDDFPRGIGRRINGKLKYIKDKSRVDLKRVPSIYLNEVLNARLYERQQAFLETQRGCKKQCKYCVYHKGFSTVIYYPLKRIFQELDYLILEKQITALRIFDAIFTSDLERAKKIVRHLYKIKQRNKDRLPWIYWEFVYNSVDKEFLKLISKLKNSAKICNVNSTQAFNRPQLYSDLLKGYVAVNCVGIQSFHKRALCAVGRTPINFKNFDNFMNMVNKYNIVLKLDLIMGLPFETLDSYLEGLEIFLPYFKNTDHILNIHRLQILPGSDLETLCQDYKMKYSTDAPHTVTATETFTENEIIYSSKLSAILFRILNSPLRPLLYTANERTGEKFVQILEQVLEGVCSSRDLKKSRLIQEEIVDDVYWNDKIYREIPSSWLRDFLKKY